MNKKVTRLTKLERSIIVSGMLKMPKLRNLHQERNRLKTIRGEYLRERSVSGARKAFRFGFKAVCPDKATVNSACRTVSGKIKQLEARQMIHI